MNVTENTKIKGHPIALNSGLRWFQKGRFLFFLLTTPVAAINGFVQQVLYGGCIFLYQALSGVGAADYYGKYHQRYYERRTGRMHIFIEAIIMVVLIALNIPTKDVTRYKSLATR